MPGKAGFKPHKRPHKGCIGYIYCKRLDKTYDIGDQAMMPDKKGYLCDCGYMTRLDPFKHKVVYYDDDVRGQTWDDEPEVAYCHVKREECKNFGKCKPGNSVFSSCTHIKDKIDEMM